MAPWARTAIEVIVGGGSALLLLGGTIGLISKSVGSLTGFWTKLTTVLKTDVAANDAKIESNKLEITSLQDLNLQLQAQFDELQKLFDLNQAAIDQRTQEIASLGYVVDAVGAETAAIDLNTAARLRNIETPLGGGTVGGVTAPGETGPVQSETTTAPAGTSSSVVAEGAPAAESSLIAGEGAATGAAAGSAVGEGMSFAPGLAFGAGTAAETLAPEGAGLLSRAGTILGGSGGLVAGGLGLGLGYGAFQLQHALGNGSVGGKIANVAGDVAVGAGIGSVLPGVGTGVGALIGGGVGLAKGLWNVAQGPKNAGVDQQWSDAITQQQQGVSGSVQQKFFNDLASKNAGPGPAIDNFDKLGVSIQGVSDILNGGLKSTQAATQVYGDWAKSIGITTAQLGSLGVSSKEAGKFQDDLKKALGGDTGAASDLKDRLSGLGGQTGELGELTSSLTGKQKMSLDTLKIVAGEIDKHSKALAENKKQQQDLLPATQATNAMMAAMGTNADGTAIDISKLPPAIKNVVDAFQGMLDPTKAFDAAEKDPINIALQGTSDFQTFTEAFSDAQKTAQDALDAQASSQAKAINGASKAQTTAANAALKYSTNEQIRGIAESARMTNAAISSMGVKGLGSRFQSIEVSAGAREAEAQLREQADAQKAVGSGAVVTAKQIKDSYGNNGVAQVSLQEFSAEMTKSVAEQTNWNANLKKIAQEAASHHIDASDLLAGLEKAGRPAEVLAGQLAAPGGIGAIAALSAQSTQLAGTKVPVLSSAEFVTSYQKQLKQATQFKDDLAKVAVATGGAGGLVAQMFLSKKDDPGAQAALHDLATHLTPKAVAEWENMATQAANGFGQAAAISFSKQTDIVQNAISTLQHTSASTLQTAAGKLNFWKTVATASGVDSKTAQSWVKSNVDVILRAVGGSTGLTTNAWKALLGPSVDTALKADGGIGTKIKKDADSARLKPYTDKVTSDISSATKIRNQWLKDVNAKKPDSITINADVDNYKKAIALVSADTKHLNQVRMTPEIELKDNGYLSDISAAEKAWKQLQTDTANNAPRAKLTADTKDYESKIGAVKKDVATFKGGSVTNIVISADTKNVDTAFRNLQNEKKRGHDPVQYQIDLKAWNTAKKQLTDDQNLLHLQGNKPIQPKVVLTGLTQFKQDVQTAIKERNKIGGTVKVTVDPNVTTGSKSSSSGSNAPSPQQSGTFKSPATAANPNPVGHYEGKVWISGAASGGFLHFADGGRLPGLPGQAQIRKAGTVIQWAEPETGGEAFIPMSMAKRSRSLGVLDEVARHFGVGLTKYADGGMRPMGVGMLGNQRVMAATPQIVHVQQRVPVSQQHNYQFGDIQGPSMKDVQRYADQKARMRRFRGDG